MTHVDIDDSDFKKKITGWLQDSLNRRQKATRDIATEVLRLSQREVPHDKGTLQNSGFVEDAGDDSIVGYSTPYAARLHEHPEYHFQKGRKGKYLEDPIKNNIRVFADYYKKILGMT